MDTNPPDDGARRKNLGDVAAQRWAEVDGAERTMVIGTRLELTAASTAIDREFFDYWPAYGGDPAPSTKPIPTDFARNMGGWTSGGFPFSNRVRGSLEVFHLAHSAGHWETNLVHHTAPPSAVAEHG